MPKKAVTAIIVFSVAEYNDEGVLVGLTPSKQLTIFEGNFDRTLTSLAAEATDAPS